MRPVSVSTLIPESLLPAGMEFVRRVELNGVQGMRYVGPVGRFGAVAIVGALLVGGCARHMVHETVTQHRSIKDDQVQTTRPAPVAARPLAVPKQPASPPVVTAVQPVSPPKAPTAPNPPPAAQPRTADEAAPPVRATPTAAAPVAPAPATPQRPVEAPDFQATELQLEEGRKLFAAGRVIDARKRFIAAMNGPIPEALLALARSFDTHYLSQLQRSDGAPDMKRAQSLYERAVERGAPEAQADLNRLLQATGQPAAPKRDTP